MAPIRRYLRLTAHSVLEVRIYLDNPADASRWLLSPRDPALPRVIEAVRPLVLPKLREENERARGKGKGAKRKGVKDVVARDDFDVSVFLTELSTRHGILTRQKMYRAGKTDPSGVKRGGAKMTGTREEPMEVRDDVVKVVLREETEDEDKLKFEDVPRAWERDIQDETDSAIGKTREDGMFVSDSEESEEGSQMQQASLSKGQEIDAERANVEGKDDKKKMAFNTTYDGFSIYNRILCLVVKRKGISKGKQLIGGSGQAMMEEWIASTQLAEGQLVDE